MATIIEEIPIVSEEAQPDEVDPATEDAPVEEQEPIAPAPKRRGRPAGAKNKAKPKVVAAKPKKKAPPPPSESESEEEEYEPPPRKHERKTRAAPREESEEEEPVLDARQVAAEMLSMLSQRNVDRNQAKRQKYASWFPTNRVVY